ncbi:MAG: hypothetical protein ACTHQ3_15460 [Motilibacteraceae bacterium]
MNDEPNVGLNRRDLLRRTALVGGAVVWTTPVVQSLGGVALAATGTAAGGSTQDDCEPELYCWLEWLSQIFCIKWTRDARRIDFASASNLSRGVRENSGFFDGFSSIYSSFRYGSGRLDSSIGCTSTGRGLQLSLPRECSLKAWFLCSYPTDCEPGTPPQPDCHWTQAPAEHTSDRSGRQSRSLLAAPQLAAPLATDTGSVDRYGPALPTSSSVCDFTFA